MSSSIPQKRETPSVAQPGDIHARFSPKLALNYPAGDFSLCGLSGYSSRDDDAQLLVVLLSGAYTPLTGVK